jgi:hypothetical protein
MKDTKGREWSFRFTALTVRDLAASTKLDTKSLTGENSLLVQIGQDEALLLQCLWITIKPQAAKLGVTEEEWLESLDNEGLQSATEEWMQAYINFSHPARRDLLTRTMTATKRKMSKATRDLETLLAGTEIDEVINREVDKALSQSSTSALTSPVSSESSPGATPSES